MQVVAERQGDAARTYVLMIGTDKKLSRGLSETHPSFEAAKSATEKIAAQAVKLDWVRRVASRGFAPKPDAFSSIPPAPKAKTAPASKVKK
jgi:hypothetical protein